MGTLWESMKNGCICLMPYICDRGRICFYALPRNAPSPVRVFECVRLLPANTGDGFIFEFYKDTGTYSPIAHDITSMTLPLVTGRLLHGAIFKELLCICGLFCSASGAPSHITHELRTTKRRKTTKWKCLAVAQNLIAEIFRENGKGARILNLFFLNCIYLFEF